MPTPISEDAPHNVFISWSSKRSALLAEALFEWLPSVVQAARPWMSSENIESGQRWRSELNQQLQTLKIGILCLTPENLEAPWVVFEAGVLSRVVDEKSRLIPYRFDLPKIDSGPLADFQGVSADPDDRETTWKLVKSINSAMPSRVADAALRKCFERSWSDLEKKLREIPPKAPKAEAASIPPVNPEDKLEQILDRLRLMGRDLEETRERLSPRPELPSVGFVSAMPTNREALEAMYDVGLRPLDQMELDAAYLKKYGQPVSQVRKTKSPFRR